MKKYRNINIIQKKKDRTGRRCVFECFQRRLKQLHWLLRVLWLQLCISEVRFIKSPTNVVIHFFKDSEMLSDITEASSFQLLYFQPLEIMEL